MAFVLKDRVQETTTTTGTGTLTLAGAVTGFSSFAGIGNANTTYYCITDATGAWESGIGTYTSAGTTLSRDTVISNSLGTTAKINFGAGTKYVFCAIPASGSVFLNDVGNVGIGTSSPTVRLQVSGEAIFGGAGTYQTVYANNNSATGGGAFTVQQNGTSRGGVAVSGAWLGDTSSDLAVFSIAPNIRFYNNNSSSERMRIDSSGNVGIGTNSPSAKLDVAISSGGLVQQLSGTSGVYTRLGTASSSFYTVHNGTTDTFMYTQESSALRFGTTATERMRLDTSGNLLFNSGYGSVATAYGCRAWVNFNGTGTVAIRASGNVSSITDNGTGDYTVNFTTAMPDANYSTYVGGQGPSTASLANLTALYSAPTSNTLVSPLTSSFRFGSYSFQGNASDSAFLCVAIFR